MPLEIWLLAIAATTAAAAIQGIVGVGYGLVGVPLLSLIDPTLAPVPQLLTVLPMTLLMAWKERASLDLKGVGWLVGGRVPGAAIGAGLLAVLTQRTLDLFIGFVVIAAVIVIGSGFHVRRNKATQFGAGIASGITSLVASIGGPPTALLYTSAEAATIRSTLAAVFTLGISFTIAIRAFTGNITDTDLEISLVLAPFVLVGYGISLLVKDRFTQGGIRWGVLAVSGAAAVGLIIRALSG